MSDTGLRLAAAFAAFACAIVAVLVVDPAAAVDLRLSARTAGRARAGDQLHRQRDRQDGDDDGAEHVGPRRAVARVLGRGQRDEQRARAATRLRRPGARAALSGARRSGR